MKYILLILFAMGVSFTAHAQFNSVSTNLTGWAAGNINASVDLGINRHNTINIPVSFNPWQFGETAWKHFVVQPGWRHWFVERYVGHFISPSLFYANYTIGYDKRIYQGNAYGLGFSWGYSVLLNTRWNFLVEVGVGVVYTPYTEQLRPKYIKEFDDEYTYRHHRFLILPTKLNLSFAYLF